ncbi:MAG: hypothetical protein P8R54_23535 [Myxococcota bacterium]|nr:hypothetical protein [Myxococcota bacterium]
MKSHQPSRPVLRLVGEPEEFHNGAWHHGRLLVLSEHATLPDRCIVCNAAAEGQTLKKTLYWHNPFLLALLALQPLIYGLLAFFLKRTRPVELPMCSHHQRLRRVMGWVGSLLVLSFPLCALIGISISDPRLLLPGLLASLVGLLVLLVGRNEVWAYRITESHAFIWGSNREWLDTLPEWTEHG